MRNRTYLTVHWSYTWETPAEWVGAAVRMSDAPRVAARSHDRFTVAGVSLTSVRVLVEDTALCQSDVSILSLPLLQRKCLPE